MHNDGCLSHAPKCTTSKLPQITDVKGNVHTVGAKLKQLVIVHANPTNPDCSANETRYKLLYHLEKNNQGVRTRVMSWGNDPGFDFYNIQLSISGSRI